jgi:hypothetical protein
VRNWCEVTNHQTPFSQCRRFGVLGVLGARWQGQQRQTQTNGIPGKKLFKLILNPHIVPQVIIV